MPLLFIFYFTDGYIETSTFYLHTVNPNRLGGGGGGRGQFLVCFSKPKFIAFVSEFTPISPSLRLVITC
jgi:hypothetical protein